MTTLIKMKFYNRFSKFPEKKHFFAAMEEHVLDTNAGKQQSEAATDV